MAITDLRLYVDEVGNSDLRGAALDPNVRYLSLTGVLTTRSFHDGSLTRYMEAAKVVLPNHTTTSPVILHRRDIVRREGPFGALRDPKIAAAFDEALMTLLGKAPFRAITVQIDKKLYLESYSTWHYDPYHYCLKCLVERFVLYAKRHGAKGSVIIEPRFKKSDKKLKASYERIYNHGTDTINASTVQDRLLSKDIQFFPKSANIAGLQLADLIAHPSARCMRFLREGATMPADFGAKIADILISSKYARNPKTLEIEGWGTKWLP